MLLRDDALIMWIDPVTIRGVMCTVVERVVYAIWYGSPIQAITLSEAVGF